MAIYRDDKVEEKAFGCWVMIEAGRVVTCPKCNEPMLKLKRSLCEGDIICADIFEAIGGTPTPIDGQEVPSHCGVQPIRPFAAGSYEIHLGEGWNYR